MRCLHRVILSTLLGINLLATACIAVAADAWPAVAVPDGARTQSIASDLVFDGRATRLLRFESDADETELRAFFLQQFGGKTVVNRLRGDLVIATRQGDFFVTVQLHPVGQDTQGSIMITRLAGPALGSTAAVQTRAWLPPRSEVVSQLQADDAGKRSLTLMAVNTDGLTANLDAVIQAMTASGLRLVHRDANGNRAGALLSSATEDVQVVVTQANGGACRAIVIIRTGLTQ